MVEGDRVIESVRNLIGNTNPALGAGYHRRPWSRQITSNDETVAAVLARRPPQIEITGFPELVWKE